MKVIILLTTFVSLAYATNLSEFLTPDGKFITKYDDIDVDNIFKVQRLLKPYTDCLRGLRCVTKPGQFLKGTLRIISISIYFLYFFFIITFE